MKKKLSSLLLLAMALSAISCSQRKPASEKSTEATDSIQKTDVSQTVTEKDELRKYVLTLPSLQNESQYKVEIIPSVWMEVDDCNGYGLQGKFEKSVDLETGLTNLIFKSDGEVFQTAMGCPTDSMHYEYVTGPATLMDYDSSKPINVEVPAGKNIEIRHTVWKVSEMISVAQSTEEILKDFPEYQKKLYGSTYEGYMIKLTNIAEDSKIELIPGITKAVDCNEHWITNQGSGSGGMVEVPYTFYFYESDGKISSTRMACPDGKLTKKFIHSMNPMTVPFKKSEPIVIFISKGLELRYRIWDKTETNKK